MGVVGDAWERLFDETIAGLEFDVDGETLSIEGTLNLLTDQDRANARPARANWRECSATTSKPLPACTTRWPRKKRSMTAGAACPPPQTGRHLSNHVEPEVVEALRNAVVAAYPRLRHRYYELKAQMAGAGHDAGLGPQRAPADGRSDRSSTGTRPKNGDGRLYRV